ncbi:hypothetical protein Peur_060548 [Populus x canadensis]
MPGHNSNNCLLIHQLKRSKQLLRKFGNYSYYKSNKLSVSEFLPNRDLRPRPKLQQHGKLK